MAFDYDCSQTSHPSCFVISSIHYHAASLTPIQCQRGITKDEETCLHAISARPSGLVCSRLLAEGRERAAASLCCGLPVWLLRNFLLPPDTRSRS